MLLLSKAIISIILGFISAIILGYIIIPFLKKLNISQNVSHKVNERHLKKQGTPTMGGFIFIIPTLSIIFVLFILGKLTWSWNFLIIIFTFIAYALLGFTDDYKKIKYKSNEGLSILFKFFLEVLIALIFFYFYIYSGNNTVIDLGFFCLDLKFIYGFFILFLLIATSNAVNITDGLDGLCAGCSVISFICYAIIAFNSSYINGYMEIGIFCFILSGCLLGFLFFNFYPAKIFMGDLGSLSLGATLASIAIILKNELSLILIGIIYIIEAFSSFAQIIAIRVFKKKIFKKSPIHHHLEELGFHESDIIKIFYTISLIFTLIALLYYVWY